MATPSKYHIVKHWQDWLIERCFDLGEPSCWACGKWWDTKYDIDNPAMPWEEVLRRWDKVRPLQRCHIIPKSLGGSDEPSNLFLMCAECHDLAPNTPFSHLFFKWIDKQSWFTRSFLLLKNELEVYDIKGEDKIGRLSSLLNSNEFKKWSDNKCGLHGSQAGHGIKVTISSIVALLVEFEATHQS